MRYQYYFAGFVIAVLLYVVFFQVNGRTQQDEMQVIRAKSIELVDDNGVVRASIVLEESGEMVFRLRDSKGDIRVKLGASETGSGLLLLNGNSDPGIQMLSSEKSTSINMTDWTGKKRKVEP